MTTSSTPNTPRASPIRNRTGDDPTEGLLDEFRERLQGDRWRPAADIFETEEALVVRLELPGVAKEQVRVHVDATSVRVTGQRQVPTGPTARRLHRMEIAFGPFERVVPISVPFDRDGVRAHLDEGFLDVIVPKRSTAGRRVEVDSE